VTTHLAIDLGAGSGRAFLGRIDEDRLAFEEVHRFRYDPRETAGHLRWDAARLFGGIRETLGRAAAAAARAGTPIASVGVDSWGVDYGLLDEAGTLVEEPIAYRDARTAGMMEAVFSRVPRRDIFARTGLQFMELNTLFQLAAHVRDGLSSRARHLLLVPDLCHHFLCGSLASELTDASTTQLLDARTGTWDDDLFRRLDLPRGIMPPVVGAGTELGVLRLQLARESCLERLRVIAPATHDTAAAVAATPLEDGVAFISSGTWSLVGIERRVPLLDEAVERANFTNEAGAFGRTCFLKNVAGLWLLESCRKEWNEGGAGPELAALIAGAEAAPGFAGFVYPDDGRFFNPRSMVREIGTALSETGQPVPDDPARVARVVLDSLALRYASVIERIEAVTGTSVHTVRVVGGGSLNRYLNQATANASGRPVEAGPVEATVAGNVLVQAVASGTLGSLEEGRRLVRRTASTLRFEPRDADAWAAARSRYREIEPA
jgi:rhamnulokinase